MSYSTEVSSWTAELPGWSEVRSTPSAATLQPHTQLFPTSNLKLCEARKRVKSRDFSNHLWCQSASSRPCSLRNTAFLETRHRGWMHIQLQKTPQKRTVPRKMPEDPVKGDHIRFQMSLIYQVACEKVIAP